MCHPRIATAEFFTGKDPGRSRVTYPGTWLRIDPPLRGARGSPDLGPRDGPDSTLPPVRGGGVRRRGSTQVDAGSEAERRQPTPSRCRLTGRAEAALGANRHCAPARSWGGRGGGAGRDPPVTRRTRAAPRRRDGGGGGRLAWPG